MLLNGLRVGLPRTVYNDTNGAAAQVKRVFGGYERYCGFGSEPLFFRPHGGAWRVKAREALDREAASCIYHALVELLDENQFDLLYRLGRQTDLGLREPKTPAQAAAWINANGWNVDIWGFVPVFPYDGKERPEKLYSAPAPGHRSIALVMFTDAGVFQPHWVCATSVNPNATVDMFEANLEWLNGQRGVADLLVPLMQPAIAAAHAANWNLYQAPRPAQTGPVAPTAVASRAASSSDPHGRDTFMAPAAGNANHAQAKFHEAVLNCPFFSQEEKNEYLRELGPENWWAVHGSRAVHEELVTEAKKGLQWQMELGDFSHACGVHAPPFHHLSVGGVFERRFYHIGGGVAPVCNAHVSRGFPNAIERAWGNATKKGGWLWELHPKVMAGACIQDDHAVYIRVDAVSIKDKHFLVNGCYNPEWVGVVRASGCAYKLKDPIGVRFDNADYMVFQLARVVYSTVHAIGAKVPLKDFRVQEVAFTSERTEMPDPASMPNKKCWYRVVFAQLAKGAQPELVAQINTVRDQTLNAYEDGSLAADFDPVQAVAALVEVRRVTSLLMGVEAGAYTAA